MAEVRSLIAALSAELHLAIALVPTADSTRLGERNAGLTAARLAFADAGEPEYVILGHEPDGRPKWPGAWTGSVAHGAGYAVAAVTRRQVHAAVGIDIERSRALPLEDAELVLDADEYTIALADPSTMPTVLWSAKESAFKAWATASGGLAGVDPREVHIDVDHEVLTATPRGSLAARGLSTMHLTGRWVANGDVIVTVLVAPAAHPQPTFLGGIRSDR
jgi:4'-phosphopantetheinyl transferase EntD